MDCVICGVGGQGNVLASRLIASVLMARGEEVKTAETIGMAQRGGCVTSHVRGQGAHSPLVPRFRADCLIAFEPAEAVRNLLYVKSRGFVVTNTKAIQPTSAALSGSNYDGSEALEYLRKMARAKCIQLVEVNAEEVCEELKNPRVLNVVMLASASASGALSISREELDAAIDICVKEKFRKLNHNAVELAQRAPINSISA